MPFMCYNPITELPCFREFPTPDVFIPTSDWVAWRSYPAYRHVYNKLEVALSQYISCAPNGVNPDNFPVILKPIYNMFNWGKDSFKINSLEDLRTHDNPGLFWMEYLQGDHLSIDFAVIDGCIVWECTFRGYPKGEGTFDFWEKVECPTTVRKYLNEWMSSHLRGYTGNLNFETIGGKIIECHLRMGDIDKFGNSDLLHSIVSLYKDKTWTFHEPLPKLFIFALFGTPDIPYAINEKEAQNICKDLICWRVWPQNKCKDRNHPPGGVRLAQICSENFQAGAEARQKLAKLFIPAVHHME